jgi:hypothetical protein
VSLIFGDESESDPAKVVFHKAWVYGFLRLEYAVYEALERDFVLLKQRLGISPHLEIKWGSQKARRRDFLALLSRPRIEVFYYVVLDETRSHGERRRREALLAAFRSLAVTLGQSAPPLVILDRREHRQDSHEGFLIERLRKEGLKMPPYAFMPSDLVVGLQLVDLVVGALRTFEADGNESAYAVIQKQVRDRIVM